MFTRAPQHFTIVSADRKEALVDAKIRWFSCGYEHYYEKALYNQIVPVTRKYITLIQPYIESQIQDNQYWFVRIYESITTVGALSYPLHDRFEAVFNKCPHSLHTLEGMFKSSACLYLSELQTFLVQKMAEMWFKHEYFVEIDGKIPCTNNFSIIKMAILWAFGEKKKTLTDRLTRFYRTMPNTYFRTLFEHVNKAMTIQNCIDCLIQEYMEKIDLVCNKNLIMVSKQSVCKTNDGYELDDLETVSSDDESATEISL